MTRNAHTEAANLTTARRAYLRAESKASQARERARHWGSHPTLVARATEATLEARRAYATFRALRDSSK